MCYCALLCVWEPSTLPCLRRGTLATATVHGRTVFLGFRLLVAGTGIGAGMALWHRQPHAVALAKAALTLSAISAVIRFGWFPGNTPPGMRLPTALVLIGYNAAWFAYLVTSPQVRDGPERSKPSARACQCARWLHDPCAPQH